MGSSLKKLKKLNKKAAKVGSKGLAQLSRPIANTGGVQSQLGQIGRDAGISAVRELATPFNPLISWFEGGSDFSLFAANQNQFNSAAVSSGQPMSSIAQLPLKSPPCKSCPAKMGGLCKCARKKFGV